MGGGFMLVALVATQARHGAREVAVDFPEPNDRTRMPAIPTDDTPADTPSRVVDSPSPSSTPPPPPIERKIPVFPARFLEGCSPHDLDVIEHAVSAAIARGSPLYNEGEVAACSEVYETAAGDLVAALPARCHGPIQALGDGRTAASRLVLPSARAWAMRDAFDGLVEAMDRSRAGGVSNL